MNSCSRIYVIANVTGRFRYVGAIHIQDEWVPGIFKNCITIIKTFSDPANRLALEHELRWATTPTNSDWDSEDLAHLPFPFIHTYLALALYRAFEIPWSDGSVRMAPRQVEICIRTAATYTLLDITNLSNPRHCFIILNRRFCSKEEAREIPILEPLSLLRYAKDVARFFKAYNEEYTRSIEDSNNIPLIDAAALNQISSGS